MSYKLQHHHGLVVLCCVTCGVRDMAKRLNFANVKADQRRNQRWQAQLAQLPKARTKANAKHANYGKLLDNVMEIK